MPEKKEAAADEAGIEERIRALDRMTTGELADEYERLHRRECRTRHRAYLSARSRGACRPTQRLASRGRHEDLRMPPPGSTAVRGQ